MSARNRLKRILAFDWDNRTLRVVHAQIGKRGISVDRLLSVKIPDDLDPNDPQQMGHHIKRVLEQEGIHTRHAVVDIPRDQAILKTLRLPVAAPDELPGIVQIQIAKELSFPVNEAAVDFAVQTHEEGAVTADVLVAATRLEVLKQYEATFAAAGLKLERVGLRTYASKVAACALLKHALPERVLFLDIRPKLSDITVLKNGALAFSRSAEVIVPFNGEDQSVAPRGTDGGDGAPDLALAPSGDTSATQEMALQKLVLEVMRSIEAYRGSDPGASIDHVVLGGDSGLEEALAEAIQQRLSITTETYNPASTFGWEPDEGAGASAFAASLGLVLGQDDTNEPHFDFLHPKKAVTATQKRLKKAPMVAAVVVLFVAAIPIAFFKATEPKRAELAELNRQIEVLTEDVKANKKFLKFMDGARAFDKQHIWVDVMHDIITALPSHEELVVKRMDMNQKDGRIVLKTEAKQRDTALTAIRQLEAFRRDGREAQRFKVNMGAQAVKTAEEYPFVQDLRITLMNDEARKKGKKKSKRG